MLRVADGDEHAFRQVFDAYKLKLFSFAEGIARSAADAEEIVQDVFTTFWLNRGSVTTIQKPENYLYSMVRNRCIDHLRKTARDKKLIEQVWALNGEIDDSTRERLSQTDLEQLVQSAIGDLPEQKQRVFRLSRHQGYSHQEIADLTGLSKSRVNNILVESLKYVKEYLTQHSPGLALLFWISSWDKIFF